MSEATSMEAMSELIRTPDQRLRIFVSSTLEELDDERRAARRSIEQLHLTPVLFELGARAHAPPTIYRAYLDQSHVFVGIYWQRYGWIAPGMEISGIEDEYGLATRKPRLIYVKTPAPKRDPRLQALLQRIGQDDISYKAFNDAAELGDLLADDLIVLLTEHFEETVTRARVSHRHKIRLPVPPNPLVDRVEAVETVSAALLRDGHRLVSLVGAGGIGKTRLALEIAKRVEGSFPGGSVFVDLAPVEDASHVARAVATALGVDQEGTRPLRESIHEVLNETPTLLLLDNFDLLVDSAPDLTALLEKTPLTSVLVTSRVPLKVRAAWEFAVEPLPIPPTDVPLAADAMDYDSVALFVQRAEAARPGFELTDDNAADVGALCRRLDGLPLALELAAARVRILSPKAMLQRIEQRLDLFKGAADLPPRQRTLRATIEWSFRLLDPDEKRAFARLGVFAGNWNLAASEYVIGDGIDALDTLSSLVDKGLVMVEHPAAGDPRFRMLETVRQYAREVLEDLGETDDAHRALAAYIGDFCEQASLGIDGPEWKLWFARLDEESANVRAVIRWSIEADDLETACRVGLQLWLYWWFRNRGPELHELISPAIAKMSDASPGTQTLFLMVLFGTSFLMGYDEEAIQWGKRLLEASRAAGPRWCEAFALVLLASSVPFEDGEARRYGDEAGALMEELGWTLGLAFSGLPRGLIALLEGNVDEAIAVTDDCLEAARSIRNEQVEAHLLIVSAVARLSGGDLEGARAELERSAGFWQELGDREGSANCLQAMAAVALFEGRSEAAALGIGAANALRRTIGVGQWPLLRPLSQQLADAVRAALGDEAFEACLERGSRLTEEDAFDLVLDRKNPASV